LAGTFDNTYYTSSSGSSPSGNIYVCGTTAAAPLYQVPISGNIMGTPVAGPDLSTSGFYGRCSPASEFFNTTGTTATGSVTMSTVPNGGFTSTTTVTVGSFVYTFVSALTGSTAHEVLYYTGSGSTTRQNDAAGNLRAAIDNSASECVYPSGGPCFLNNGATANSAVTHPAGVSSNVVSLTAATSGSGGDFSLSTNNTTDITTSGGNNGTSGTDYLFLSVYAGSQSGCTASANNGCVMSFDVTTPSAFSGSLAALGTINTAALTSQSPTGGIIVDNALTSPTGTSQIYFQVADTASPSSPCTTAGGNCAVQASQTAP